VEFNNRIVINYILLITVFTGNCDLLDTLLVNLAYWHDEGEINSETAGGELTLAHAHTHVNYRPRRQ